MVRKTSAFRQLMIFLRLLVHRPSYFLETLFFEVFTVFHLYLKDRLSWFVTITFLLQISTFKMETFWRGLSGLTSDVQTVSFTSCPVCFDSTNLQFLTPLKETTSYCKFAFCIKILFIYVSANSICKLSLYRPRIFFTEIFAVF